MPNDEQQEILNYFEIAERGAALAITLAKHIADMIQRGREGRPTTDADVAAARAFMETERALAKAQLDRDAATS